MELSQWCQAIGQEATGRNIHEFHLKVRKNFFAICAGDCTLEQIAQSTCGVSFTGDIQEPSGHIPVPWALEWPCLNEEVGPDSPTVAPPKPTIELWCHDYIRVNTHLCKASERQHFRNMTGTTVRGYSTPTRPPMGSPENQILRKTVQSVGVALVRLSPYTALTLA